MPKRILQGTVTSVTNKTIRVKVIRKYIHPAYKKTVQSSKNYIAHAEREVKLGESVKIIESKPISKTKKWVLLDKNVEQQ